MQPSIYLVTVAYRHCRHWAVFIYVIYCHGNWVSKLRKGQSRGHCQGYPVYSIVNWVVSNTLCLGWAGSNGQCLHKVKWVPISLIYYAYWERAWGAIAQLNQDSYPIHIHQSFTFSFYCYRKTDQGIKFKYSCYGNWRALHIICDNYWCGVIERWGHCTKVTLSMC